MKSENGESLLKDKSYAFALRIVKLARYMQEEHKEYVLSRQALRSGTSIGANIFEALYAQSKKDFIAKLSISLKEASETLYWLNLIFDSDYINKRLFLSLFNEADEIRIMLISSIKTAKNNLASEE